MIDVGTEALDLLTVGEVAKRLRMSEAAVWRLIAVPRDGVTPPKMKSVTVGRSRRIAPEDVLAYKNELRGLDPEGNPLAARTESSAA